MPRVDGGAPANNMLMQFQSDLLAVPVERLPIFEITALERSKGWNRGPA